MILEKNLRDVGINTKGTICNKSVNILAHADDVDIITKTESTLKESFLSLERVNGNAKLLINEGKNQTHVLWRKRQSC